MACKRCNSLGVLMRVVDTLHGKDFHAEQCDCELERLNKAMTEPHILPFAKKNNEDRKVLIHDVCEAPPKSGYCSKEGVESPE